jgi:predicted transcriptional regulator of viral defense system
MTRSAADRVLTLARNKGVLRARELEQLGIARTTLTRLEQQGQLQRVGRGLYVRVDAEPSEHHTLAEVTKRVPHGVTCLLSALQFHELTTQVPHEVWLAIANKARKPSADWPPLRIVRFSERALLEDVERPVIENVPVTITSPARTVVDCFKYRSQVGLDVALEALRDYLQSRSRDMDRLWRAARLQRVTRVIQPYLEALT